eukprot:jgi/Undpi1/5445/HiC_scaffold_2.g00724.m1
MIATIPPETRAATTAKASPAPPASYTAHVAAASASAAGAAGRATAPMTMTRPRATRRGGGGQDGDNVDVCQHSGFALVHGGSSGNLALVQEGPQGDNSRNISVGVKTTDSLSTSPSHHVSPTKAAGTGTATVPVGGSGWTKRKPTKKNARNSPTKTPKSNAVGAATGREGGAADARAIAWEAAAAKAKAATAAAAAAAAAVGSGTKRNRSESIGSNVSRSATGHDLSISGSNKDSRRAAGGESQGTRISPTSVCDINSFVSFHNQKTECTDVAMHHLPQQLAPSWCTKPQDNWTSLSGLDAAVDPDDAGPFRWFIDERSLSAPGAFFQPPVENWSGSDTTDASTAAGLSSGGEGLEGDYLTVVPDIPSSTIMVDASPGGNTGSSGASCNVGLDVTAHCYPAKRRCMEAPIATIDSERLRYSADAASASDSAIAIEVNRHVEADTDGLDITSGLWLDHPQEASALMCGLGLTAPSVVGPGASLSLPSLDEDEVLGFLACEENRVAGTIGL